MRRVALRLVTFASRTDTIFACAYSPDGRRIVSGSYEKSLKLWDAETGAELATLQGHSGESVELRLFPDGRRIVSASADKTLKLWDAQTSAQPALPAGNSQEVTACGLSPDGRRIVSASLV